MTTQKCKECEKEFEARVADVKRGRGIFCSLSCGANYTNNARIAIEKICKFCKNSYLTKNKNALYCSRKCCRIASLKRKGESHNNRNKLKKDIIKLISENEFKCFICGWDEDSSDIHHIIPKSKEKNDYLSNLSIPCPNHHRFAHKNKLLYIPNIKEKFNLEDKELILFMDFQFLYLLNFTVLSASHYPHCFKRISMSYDNEYIVSVDTFHTRFL